MLFQKRKPPIRKSSFLLFEVLLSLTLLMVCLFPLVKAQFEMQNVHIKELQELEKEQKAKLNFCLLKEALFEHQISWSELKEGKTFPLPTGHVISLHQEDLTRKQDGRKGLLISTTLEIANASYTRLFFITQEPKR